MRDATPELSLGRHSTGLGTPLVGANAAVCDGNASMPMSMSEGSSDAGSEVVRPELDAGGAPVVDASPLAPESSEVPWTVLQ